ncbi:hypothetical protein DIPPA_53908 [Diplonema papillatum]|nr:hypothetical protein DIPPA_55806 [Diplonema papillatum]KAJ9442500.1 hypothetical protein DIPPA_55806 [Diplonema papillatum]KAJ9464525.1 hypothetical protein DIPPA_53908 [Diplonema papillatum]
MEIPEATSAVVQAHRQRGKARSWVNVKASKGERALLYSGCTRNKKRARPQIQVIEVISDGKEAVVELLQLYGLIPEVVKCKCGEILAKWEVQADSLGWPFWKCRCRNKGVSGSSLCNIAINKLDSNNDKKGHMRTSPTAVLLKVHAFSHGVSNDAVDTLTKMAPETHARFSRVLAKTTKVALTEAEKLALPLGGPETFIELDEFSIGLKRRGEGANQEVCYLRFLGIVERGSSLFVLRALPARWQKLMNPGDVVDLPSGGGKCKNTTSKKCVPPPPPISIAELDAILSEEVLIQLGTNEKPVFITTDGAATYRSRLDPTSSNFFWGDENKEKVRYGWVNHGREEFTGLRTTWKLLDEETDIQELSVESEERILLSIHSGAIDGLNSAELLYLRTKYREQKWLAGTQKGDGTWGHLKRLIKMKGARNTHKVAELYVAQWKLHHGGKDKLHFTLLAVGDAFRTVYGDIFKQEAPEEVAALQKTVESLQLALKILKETEADQVSVCAASSAPSSSPGEEPKRRKVEAVPAVAAATHRCLDCVDDIDDLYDIDDIDEDPEAEQPSVPLFPICYDILW